MIETGKSGQDDGIARSREPFHVWSLPGDGDWLRFFRTTQGYLLQFPDLAEFTVSHDGNLIVTSPLAGTTPATVDHLYQNQVLPLALSRQRKLVFHGSAVDLAGGAVAFLGESGMGKSTLAAALALSGAGLITDDGLILERERGHWQARPGHASLRLWDDSQEALFPDGAGRFPAAEYTAKSRIMTGGSIRLCAGPVRLQQVYFLRHEGVHDITIHPVSAGDALIELVRHAFLLDVDDRELIAHHFDQVAEMVKGMRFYGLDYPRQYGILGKIRQKILANLRADV